MSTMVPLVVLGLHLRSRRGTRAFAGHVSIRDTEMVFVNGKDNLRDVSQVGCDIAKRLIVMPSNPSPKATATTSSRTSSANPCYLALAPHSWIHFAASRSRSAHRSVGAYPLRTSHFVFSVFLAFAWKLLFGLAPLLSASPAVRLSWSKPRSPSLVHGWECSEIRSCVCSSCGRHLCLAHLGRAPRASRAPVDQMDGDGDGMTIQMQMKAGKHADGNGNADEDGVARVDGDREEVRVHMHIYPFPALRLKLRFDTAAGRDAEAGTYPLLWPTLPSPLAPTLLLVPVPPSPCPCCVVRNAQASSCACLRTYPRTRRDGEARVPVRAHPPLTVLLASPFSCALVFPGGAVLLPTRYVGRALCVSGYTLGADAHSRFADVGMENLRGCASRYLSLQTRSDPFVLHHLMYAQPPIPIHIRTAIALNERST
ncbi:hypothetical protein B0H13DRAFT_2680094 [Mycena leptocephala]|nr:hypothetical protein B0H13DRAFT_2680094 [Mycena leptocephala]